MTLTEENENEERDFVKSGEKKRVLFYVFLRGKLLSHEILIPRMDELNIICRESALIAKADIDINGSARI